MNNEGNEASWDRVARVVLGVALIIGGLAGVKGTGGYMMATVGPTTVLSSK